MPLEGQEKRDLDKARRVLERPGFLVRLLNQLGEPIEYGLSTLPAPVQQRVHKISHDALNRCMRVAAHSLESDRVPASLSLRLHRQSVMLTGGAGGFFGIAGLAVELPISTMLMFRSIAHVARSCGEDLNNPESLLNCVQVFALGGTSEDDDASETAYFAARAGLAKITADAARSLATRTVGKGTARAASPAIARFTQGIASRFSAAVSEKALAVGVPVLGAVGGATINAIFIRHFQETAWAHFRIRALERQHGAEIVKYTWTAGEAGEAGARLS